MVKQFRHVKIINTLMLTSKKQTKKQLLVSGDNLTNDFDKENNGTRTYYQLK